MFIPRRTRIERGGLVLGFASLLAVIFGTIAVAPGPTQGVEEGPIVATQVSEAEHLACVKRVTAQQQKTPEGVGIGSGGRFENPSPDYVCPGPGLVSGTNTLPVRTHADYMRAYRYNVTLAMDAAGPSPAEKLLYWGVRFLLVGLFFMYLYEATVGRLLRFIWRGSMRA